MAEKALKRILELDPVPESAQSTELNEILDEVGAKPYKTSMATLTAWCQTLIQDKKKNPPIKLFTLIGKVIDKHTPNPAASASYAARMTTLRTAIRKTYGEEIGTEAIHKSKISNSKRTFDRNQKAKQVRDKKHENAFEITMQEIKDLCDKMREDLLGDPVKYKHSILLMFELCTGARIGEVINASEFTVEKPRTLRNKEVPFIKQTGVLKKRIKNKDNVEEIDEDPPEEDQAGEQGGEGKPGEFRDAYDSRAVLFKPVLPFAEPQWLIDRLQEWRDAHEQKGGAYVEKDVKRYNNAINKLLQKRYLLPESYPGVRIKTHLLRATYAAAAYALYQTPGQTINNFIQQYLGHASLEIGLNYSFVKITDINYRKDPVYQPEDQAEDEVADEEKYPIDVEEEKVHVPQLIQPNEPSAASIYEIAALRADVAALREDNAAMRKDIRDLTELLRTFLTNQAPPIPADLPKPAPLPSRENNLEADLEVPKKLKRAAKIKEIKPKEDKKEEKEPEKEEKEEKKLQKPVVELRRSSRLKK